MSVPWMRHGYVDTSFSLNGTELEGHRALGETPWDASSERSRNAELTISMIISKLQMDNFCQSLSLKKSITPFVKMVHERGLS